MDFGVKWRVECCGQSNGADSEMSCGVELCGHQVVEWNATRL